MDEIRKDCTKIADVFLPFIMQKWYTFQELRQFGLAKISLSFRTIGHNRNMAIGEDDERD